MVLPDWISEIHFEFSRAADGEMSFKRAPLEEVLENRRRFLSSHSLNLGSVVAGELAHGAQVAVIGSAEAGRGATRANWLNGIDGMVTTEPGVLMMTTHADCAPLLVYDSASKILGQAHAGWRGLANGIVESLVGSVRNLNGTKPGELRAWVGPTIRSCCYPVGSDVAMLFPPECLMIVGDTIRLDLAAFIKLELARLGLAAENVTDSNICTSCEAEYSSFRRDGPQTHAMALVTGIPNGS